MESCMSDFVKLLSKLNIFEDVHINESWKVLCLTMSHFLLKVRKKKTGRRNSQMVLKAL